MPSPSTATTTAKKSPDLAFRTCIAFLLLVQTLVWALTLLDLLSPGKPRALLRSGAEGVARVLMGRQKGEVETLVVLGRGRGWV